MDDETCYIHGVKEPVTPETYRVCFECNHAYTKQELLDEHNKILARLGGEREIFANRVVTCPLCVHDF
jgi:hypothetical protein